MSYRFESYGGSKYIINMIPKSQLEDSYYLGICRNTHIARWDSNLDKFIHLRFKFGWMKETIEHFEDVKDKGLDGFIPVQKINKLPYKEIRRIKEEVGY